MFLALDYTIGAFFWFIVGGIALISLTIFLARPESSSEKFKELTSRTTHHLKGNLVSSTDDKKTTDNESNSEDDSSEYSDARKPMDTRYTIGLIAIVLILGSLFGTSVLDFFNPSDIILLIFRVDKNSNFFSRQ